MSLEKKENKCYNTKKLRKNKMFDITPKTLKWAYKKLKNYIYYSSPSSYLKDKIINFESNYNENSFDDMAENLNIILSKEKYTLIKDEKVTYTIFPKKDGISEENNNVIVENFNVFIDMPLQFYLLDIIFTLELFENMNSNSADYSFGNDFNYAMWEIKEGKRPGNILENRLLFANFNSQYDSWKNKVYTYLDENADNDCYIVKMDFKRSYYNVYFNIRDFIQKHVSERELNNPICEFECELYSYYSSIIDSVVPQEGFKKKTNYVHLPIGLFSSACIYNILLEDFDKYMLAKAQVYSRYVDDILVVLSKTGKNSISSILDTFFPELFDKGENDEYTIKHLLEEKGKYIINRKKVKILTYKKGYNLGKLKQKLNKIIKPSLDVIEEMDFEEETFDEADLYKHDYLRSVINRLKIGEPEEKFEFLKNISDAELINIFGSWKNLLSHKKNYDFFKARIEGAIKKIELKNCNDEAKSKLVSALWNEFDFATNSEKYKKYLLCDISQNRIFEHINHIDEEYENLFYPLNITFDEITLFLSQKYENINDDFFTRAILLYKKANSLSIQAKSKIVCQENNLFYFQPTKLDVDSVDKKIRISVANINLTEMELKKTDMQGEFPSTYSLMEFLRIINLSKNLGAEIVVFPEFALPEQFSLDVIKYCRKIGISIVTGLTHKNINGKLVNYILIRDNDLDFTIFKWKNYMPYEEKQFCFENNVGYLEPQLPYYFIFDNGKYRYSTMTCFEATSIQDRALLSDKIEVLYIPVFNKDTYYFSNIIASYVRDASCFIAQANSNEYGDSRISGPFGHIKMDIAKLKGGINNYFVVGDIDLGLVYEKNKKGNDLESCINMNNCFEIYNDEEFQIKMKEFNGVDAKPLSAGHDRYNTRKNNGI